MTLSTNTSNTAGIYSSVGLRIDIESASPHRLILMLLDGAVDKIRAARTALERNDIAAKGASVSWAISILEGLRRSLDFERGGDLADNLNRLYEYVARQLLHGNLDNDAASFDEAIRLLSEIRTVWIGIGAQVEGEAVKSGENELGSIAHAIG